MSTQTQAKQKTYHMVLTALLMAIIAIMSFTPLGYFKTAFVEITLITIPVVIGAILLGPATGALLGGVFGITSFIQCFGFSPFGAALLSINPVYTFILCLVPRVLMGWLCGLIYQSFAKVDKTKYISYGVASLAGPLLNTILFMSGLILMFGQTEFILSFRGGKNVLAFAVGFVWVNGLIEAIATFVVAFGVTKALHLARKKKLT